MTVPPMTEVYGAVGEVAIISGNYQSYIVSVHNPAPIDMVDLLVRKYQLYSIMFYQS